MNNSFSRVKKIVSTALCFTPLLLQAQDWEKLKTSKVESSNLITWEQVSPGNAGFANLLRWHPTIPGRVLLCPDMWNAYQSDDYGNSWYGVTDPDGNGSMYHLRDLYYSPQNPDKGIAIGSAILWMTKDGGKNWSHVKNCPWYKVDKNGEESHSWIRKVGAIAIDPTDENTWFVAGGMNVRGQDWLSCYMDVTVKNPQGKKALLEGKLWRTQNSGKTWDLVNQGLQPTTQIGRIIIHPNNPDLIFASANDGIYRSDNGGDSWKVISNGQLDNNTIMDMDFYFNPITTKFSLYVIDQVRYIPHGKTMKSTGGIFRSDDLGKTWCKMNGNLALDLNRLTGGVSESYFNYLAKWFGWGKPAVAKNKYPELPKDALQYYSMISADPSREGSVYVGFSDPQIGNSIMPGRLWVTDNNGKSWTNTARLYQETWEKDKDYWEERGNPWHSNMTVGHESPHMRFGKNYALRSMRGLDVGADGAVMIISDHSTMLSRDHGKTWMQMDEEYTPSGAIIGRGNSNLPGLTIAQDKRKATTLLGSGEHRVWIPANDSPDDRIAIKFITSAQETVSCMAFDPYDVDKVYSTSSRQAFKQNIFQSSDRGQTWHNHGVATPASNRWLDDYYTNALTIDPIDNRYMYFGITDIVDPSKGEKAGFYCSQDGGKTFTQRNEGLPQVARINDLVFDPRDASNQSLFVALQKSVFEQDTPIAPEGGLYHSTDRGLTWSKVKTPTAIESVQFLKFDHTNRLYITTGYRGGGAGVWYSDNFGKSWHQTFNYAQAESIDVSPYDRNYIAVTCRMLAKNPGVYVSKDRGKTWTKNNTSIGIPHQIEDIKFDIHNPNEMWLATLGCGFYKGKINTGKELKQIVIDQQEVQLSPNQKHGLRAKAKHKISWRSDNTTVVKVSKQGTLQAVGKGMTKVWAISKDGRYADYSVITVQ